MLKAKKLKLRFCKIFIINDVKKIQTYNPFF